MSQQIKIEAVTKEPREWKGQLSWGVKIPNGKTQAGATISANGWITFYRTEPPTRGEVLDVNITERKAKNGAIYVDAFPVMPPLAPPETTSNNGTAPVAAKLDDTWSQNNGKKVPWNGCIVFAKAAHELALVLEPDEYDDAHQDGVSRIRTDKSVARAAILNTLMIAFTGGKILVAKDDDDAYVPPPADDDIPF